MRDSFTSVGNWRVQHVGMLPVLGDQDWAVIHQSAREASTTPVVALLSPTQSTRMNMHQAGFYIGLHWLYKWKFDKKHKIPAKRDFVRAYEPYGKLLYAKLRLCMELHPQASDLYISWAEWFSLMLSESWFATINNNILPGFVSGGKCKTGGEHRMGKAEVVRTLRNFSKGLSENKNLSDKATEIHYWNLLEHAIKFVSRYPDSDVAQAWKDLSHAYSSYATAIEKDQRWTTTFEDGGKVYYQRGRGRNQGEIPVFQKPKSRTFTQQGFQAFI